jgi:prepilin-type N-terminal cleavage/methylation domain-containing protein
LGLRIQKGADNLKIMNRRVGQKGFTLIELLFIVAIIGILASIAVTQFSNYRKRSYNASAQSDLRNAATAQEAYFAEYEAYVSDLTYLAGTTYGLYTTEGVILSGTAGIDRYTMTAYHPSGNRTYRLLGPGGRITY